MDAGLILYALVAAGLVFWLRSVLGTKSGAERERPNPFAAPAPDKREAIEGRAMADDAATLPLADLRPVLPRNVTLAGDDVEKNLMELARLDREFDLAKFAQGAQDAFAIIVEAFAQADRDTLKNLLEPSVYESFNRAIALRDDHGETLSTEIHAVRKADILNVRLDGRNAYITVRFVADETCVIRNKEGAILSGDPDRITEMNDIWTFSRAIRSRDPIWLLHETRDGDVKEDHKTPVPDAG